MVGRPLLLVIRLYARPREVERLAHLGLASRRRFEEIDTLRRQTFGIDRNLVEALCVLGDGGAEIADTFAGRTGVTGSDRFTSGEWVTLSTGSPVLASAVIAFDCRIVEVRSVGSHNVASG